MGNQEQRGLSDFDLVIHAGYLTDERDVEALAIGFDATKNLFPSLTEVFPGLLYRNSGSSYNKEHQEENKEEETSKFKENELQRVQPKWIRPYIRDNVGPYYHYCSTCKMGAEDKSISLQTSENSKSSSDEENCSSFVVNDHLLVQGFENLRVCDASVFPSCISGPTALACASLGYATAQMVIKDCTGKSQ